jgi:hypothetical protein
MQDHRGSADCGDAPAEAGQPGGEAFRLISLAGQ